MEPSPKKFKCENVLCGQECNDISGMQLHLKTKPNCRNFYLSNQFQNFSTQINNQVNFSTESEDNESTMNYFPMWNHQTIDSHLTNVTNTEEQNEFNKINLSVKEYASKEKLINPEFFEQILEDDNDDDEEEDKDQSVHTNEDELKMPHSTTVCIEEDDPESVKYYSKYQFFDNFSKTKSNEEIFSIELLKLLLKANTPNYIYNDIMNIVKTYLSGRINNIPPVFCNRTTAIDHFTKRYNLQSLKPKLTQLTYKNKKFPIVKCNAEAMIMSLLQDTTNLFNDDNLLFPTIDGTPTGSIQNELPYIGDLETSKAYQQACIKLKKDPNDLPIGLITEGNCKMQNKEL